MTQAWRFVKEFGICARAVYAFSAGYKKGERYKFADYEEEFAKRFDAEAWAAGFKLADERYQAKPWRSS